MAAGDRQRIGLHVERGAQTILFVKHATAPDPDDALPGGQRHADAGSERRTRGSGHALAAGRHRLRTLVRACRESTDGHDPTHATALITARPTAALGFHAVGPSPAMNTRRSLKGSTSQQGTPSLLASSPDAGAQGTTFNVQVLGGLTHWQQGVTTASFGDGVTVNSFTVLDSVSGVAQHHDRRRWHSWMSAIRLPITDGDHGDGAGQPCGSLVRHGRCRARHHA